MNGVIPNEVFDALRNHLEQIGNSAEEGYDSAGQDEDTMTGDWGGRLRVGWRKIDFAGGISWKWRATYKKVLSKSGKSVETVTGMDGIIQIEVEDEETGQIWRKGLLFQAKNRWRTRNGKLLKQARQMEGLASGSSAVFDYGPREFRAADSRVIVGADANPKNVPDGKVLRLGDFLAGRFLPCDSGLQGMYWDARRKILTLPQEPNLPGAVRLRLRHRLNIEVKRYQA